MLKRALSPTLLALGLVLGSAAGATAAQAQVEGVAETARVAVAPPDLPEYVQPALPSDGYLWTPGYWAWDADGQDYYWVPGTWVLPPAPGLLWTPGYWAYQNGGYGFNAGYWGTEVGYYGGVDYGFGYGGAGYQGGYWRDGGFYYNESANSLGAAHVSNLYTAVIPRDPQSRRASYNGGPGGVVAVPWREEAASRRQPRIPPTAIQRQHASLAAGRPDTHAGVNHGAPFVAATPRPAAFSDPRAVRAQAPLKPYERPLLAKAPARQPATVERAPARPGESAGAAGRDEARKGPPDAHGEADRPGEERPH